MPAAVSGYHGSVMTLTTNNTYEEIFSKAAVGGSGKIFGMRLSCTGGDASVLIGPISKYADGTDNPVIIVADAAPVEFFVEGIGDVQAKQAVVSSSTITWETMGA